MNPGPGSEIGDAAVRCEWDTSHNPAVRNLLSLVSGSSQEAHRKENNFYPGGYSETEILFPYYGTHFKSKLGTLAGNHFLTVTEGHENLRPLGELCLWEGAQDIVFDGA